MKISVLISILILLVSCNKDEETDANIDIGTDLYLLNSSGEDLLDPNLPSHIEIESIKIYYVINGIEVEYDKPNLDNPRGFVIIEPEKGYLNYRMQLALNIKPDENITTTIIEWSKKDRDTIKSNIERGHYYTICSKIWLNNNLVWNNKGDRFFEIIK